MTNLTCLIRAVSWCSSSETSVKKMKNIRVRRCKLRVGRLDERMEQLQRLQLLRHQRHHHVKTSDQLQPAPMVPRELYRFHIRATCRGITPLQGQVLLCVIARSWCRVRAQAETSTCTKPRRRYDRRKTGTALPYETARSTQYTAENSTRETTRGGVVFRVFSGRRTEMSPGSRTKYTRTFTTTRMEQRQGLS